MQSPTTNITYGGIEDSGLTVKVKDSSNPRIKWQVWKKDKDIGEENEAYSAIKKMEFGEVFGVSYGEKENSFVGKDGNNVTYNQRTIYSILPQLATTAQTSLTAHNNASSGNVSAVSNSPIKDDKFWDMKAYKQCLWNYWLERIAAHKSNDSFEQTDMDMIWKVFKQIEADGNKRFFVYSEPSPINQKILANTTNVIDELPVIQQGDGLPDNSDMPEGWDIEGHPNFIPF